MDKRDGDVLLFSGVILTATIIGAVVGIPLICLGILVIVFGEEQADGMGGEE